MISDGGSGPGKSSLHLLRFHSLFCSKPVQISNHYITRTYNLISARDIRLLLDDLSCIHLELRLHACRKSIGFTFTARKATFPRKFQAWVCSRKCTTDLINYQLINSGEAVNEIFQAIAAHLLRVNQQTLFLCISSRRRHVYPVGRTQQGNFINIICPLQMQCVDHTVSLLLTKDNMFPYEDLFLQKCTASLKK